jgi:nucleoside-diphosphate-sugar epimerase
LNLVTCATGIIGSHVVLQLLREGQQDTAVRHKKSDLERVKKLFSFYTPHHQELFTKIKWIELDILDGEWGTGRVSDGGACLHARPALRAAVERTRPSRDTLRLITRKALGTDGSG